MTVLVANRGAVRVLTLNRPEKRNALNTALTQDLLEALRGADQRRARAAARHGEPRGAGLGVAGRGALHGRKAGRGEPAGDGGNQAPVPRGDRSFAGRGARARPRRQQAYALVHQEMKPLEHITILDLSRVLACPFASMILAELGARVVKLEQPGSGDEPRSFA